MPVFEYEALDRAGKKIRGIIEAETEEVIIGKLRGMGYYPLRVEPSNKKIQGRVRGDKAPKKSRFPRAVTQSANNPDVLILHSHELGFRWIALIAYLFSIVMIATLFTPLLTLPSLIVTCFVAAIGFFIGGVLWTSPRHAMIDRHAMRLAIKPGLPNDKLFQPKQTFDLGRFRAVLLSAEKSRISTKVNGQTVNYVGMVCLLGPRDCVKILGYHAADEKARQATRDAAEKIARHLSLPLVDETALYQVVTEAGEVVPQDQLPKDLENTMTISLSPTPLPGHFEGTVSIVVGKAPLECITLIVQLIERHCRIQGRGHLETRQWSSRIREGMEAPLPVVIPAGEQRFVSFSLPLPEDYTPGTSATEWRIAARLIARDASLVPVGLDIQVAEDHSRKPRDL